MFHSGWRLCAVITAEGYQPRAGDPETKRWQKLHWADGSKAFMAVPEKKLELHNQEREQRLTHTRAAKNQVRPDRNQAVVWQ